MLDSEITETLPNVIWKTFKIQVIYIGYTLLI